MAKRRFGLRQFRYDGTSLMEQKFMNTITASADALRIDETPKPEFTGFNYSYEKIYFKQVKELTSILTSGICEPDFFVNLDNTKLGRSKVSEYKIILELANALKSGNCPTGLSLKLSGNKLKFHSVRELANALKSGNCPPNFSLDLSSSKLDFYSIKKLANALKSGNCPPGLSLNLSYNQLDYRHAEELAAAYNSGKAPVDSRCNLEANHIGNLGIEKFIAVLESAFCPDGFIVDCSFIRDPEYLPINPKLLNRLSELITLNLFRRDVLGYLFAFSHRIKADRGSHSSIARIKDSHTINYIGHFLFGPVNNNKGTILPYDLVLSFWEKVKTAMAKFPLQEPKRIKSHPVLLSEPEFPTPYTDTRYLSPNRTALLPTPFWYSVPKYPVTNISEQKLSSLAAVEFPVPYTDTSPIHTDPATTSLLDFAMQKHLLEKTPGSADVPEQAMRLTLNYNKSNSIPKNTLNNSPKPVLTHPLQHSLSVERKMSSHLTTHTNFFNANTNNRLGNAGSTVPMTAHKF